MLNGILNIAAPLVLFFALVFLTGATSASVSLAGGANAGLCCQEDAEPQAPAAESECSDPSCSCLSCSAPPLGTIALNSPTVLDFRHLLERARFIPAAPGRAIDYPPEIF